MSWRHRISIVVLTVLTALPVSGTVCALVCDSAAASHAAAHHSGAASHVVAHHGASKNYQEKTTPASGPQLGGASGHDCRDHDGAIRQAVTTTASRSDDIASPSLLAAIPVHSTISNMVGAEPTFDYRTPASSTPPTASPLVLRV